MKANDSQQGIRPIDFLIVTALAEERDAFLAHLEDVRKVQLGSSPTYYISEVPVIGQEGQYRIALTMLNQVGNVEAAQHTTQAIGDLNPRAVLMVGIAGGVKGKVKLGDVVVAKQVLYCAQTKRDAKGVHQRPQILPVDQMLLDRAQNYDQSDWHRLILAGNPLTEEQSMPAAVFGPIAAGESVISDSELVAELVDIHSKLVGIEMESFGVAVAAAKAFDRPRFLAIRGICDYADEGKNDVWHEYAAATAAAFTMGFLHSRPISLTPAHHVSAEPASRGNLVVVRHQSMEFFPSQAIQPSLPPELARLDIQELRIDQSDLYVGGRLVDPLEAAKRQMDLVSRINALLDGMPNTELAYYGVAHIPLLFLAGYHLSNKHVLHFFEFNRQTGHWNQLQMEGDEPDLEVEGYPLEPNDAKGDVVMRISVSYEIAPEDVARIVSSPIASLHLRVKEPKIDNVTSELQISTYGTLFRAVLDEIHNRLPNAQCIHIFYSGPVALAVNLGRQISKTIHPRIIVYNYFAKDTPKYSWGLEITSDPNATGFLVQSGLERGA